jgi:hypothetical protein
VLTFSPEALAAWVRGGSGVEDDKQGDNPIGGTATR